MGPHKAIPILPLALALSLLGCATVMEETKVELPCVVDGKQVGSQESESPAKPGRFTVRNCCSIGYWAHALQDTRMGRQVQQWPSNDRACSTIRVSDRKRRVGRADRASTAAWRTCAMSSVSLSGWSSLPNRSRWRLLPTRCASSIEMCASRC